MYIETSVPRTVGDVVLCNSPEFDISGLSSPELSFLNHMYGSQ